MQRRLSQRTAVQISLEVELGWLKTLDKTVPGRAL
jgi:hypothetical protein